MQFIHVFFEQLLGTLVGFIHHTFNFVIDLRRRFFGIIAQMAHIAAQERFAVIAAIGHGAHFPAHAVFRHHRPGDLRSPFNVVAGAGGNIVQGQGFGYTAAKQYHQVFLHFTAGFIRPVFTGQLHGVTARHAAGDDGDFVYRVLGGQVIRDHRMARFVIRRQGLFLVGHHVALLFGAHHHFNGGFFNFLHGNGMQVFPSS